MTSPNVPPPTPSRDVPLGEPPATYAPPPPGPVPYATGAPAARLPERRPVGVTVLGVLAAIAAVLALFAGLALVAIGAAAATLGGGLFGVLGAAAGVFLLVYAAFAAVVAYGLFTRKRWAWYATIILAGLQGLQAIASLFAGDVVSSVFGLAIAGVIVWYLLSPDVQAWFGVAYRTPWRYGRAAAP